MSTIAATLGSISVTPNSWKLEISTTKMSSLVALVTTSEIGTPILPTA